MMRRILSFVLCFFILIALFPLSALANGADENADTAHAEGCTLPLDHAGECEAPTPSPTPTPESTPTAESTESPMPAAESCPERGCTRPQAHEGAHAFGREGEGCTALGCAAVGVHEAHETDAPCEKTAHCRHLNNHEGDCAPYTAEERLRAALEKSDTVSFADDVVLTGDLFIAPDAALTLSGALTIPAGLSLINAGVLALKGTAEVHGMLANAEDAVLIVMQDEQSSPGAAYALRLCASSTLKNAGEIQTHGAIVFEQGAVFSEEEKAILVYESGSVEGCGHWEAAMPVSASAFGVSGSGEITVSAENDAAMLAVDDTLQLFASGAESVVWSVSDGTGRASIDDNGLLTGLAAGTVTVKAADASDASLYGELMLTVGLAGKYVLVLNTNSDPTNRQSTGTLVFGGTGGTASSARGCAGYTAHGSSISQSANSGGYTVGQEKTIGSTNYVCIAVGEKCYVWMEKRLRADYLAAGKLDTAAAEMLQVYAGRPYTALTTLAGGDIPAKDGTGKLSILMEQIPDSTGFFAGESYITAIHVQTPSAESYDYGDLDAYAGLLAHEGQHALFQYLVCGSDAVRELPLRWLNEGLAIAAMDWVWGGDGNGSRGWLASITNNELIRSGSSLFYASYRGDSGLDYGLPYLFVRYLTDQAARKYDPMTHARKFYARSFNGDVEAYIVSVISDLGLSLSFEEALKNFYIAAVVQAGSGAYGFYGDPVVGMRVDYPIFNGASGEAHTLPGTGAIILQPEGGVFCPPTEGVGPDIVFVPFDEDASASQWGGGLGTEDDPYRIDENSILSAIALNPSGYYKLTQDIDVSDRIVFTIDSFSGTLDGDGYTIRGLNNPLIYENSGTIRNLNVELDIDGQYSGYVGGLVGHNIMGTIENVTVTGAFGGRLTGTNPFAWPTVGALCGVNYGTISRCKADVAMSFTLPANHVYMGQIAGENQYRIENCIAAGSIRAAQRTAGAYNLYAGGLAGRLFDNMFVAGLHRSYSITNLSVQATGSGNTCKVGRLVGFEDRKARDNYVQACYGLDGLPAAGGTETPSIALSDSDCLRTDAQMRIQSTFAGWDFDGVWSMPANGYPRLGSGGGGGGTTAAPVPNVPKTGYYIGEALDLLGATLTIGGESIPLTADMLFALPSLTTAGRHAVYGSYQAQVFSFDVTVTEPNPADVTALSLQTPAAKSAYFAGQFFDPDGAVLTAAIGGESVTLVSGFTVDITRALTGSDTQIIFGYYGRSVSQDITVGTRSILSITRTANPAKSTYNRGEMLSLAGLTLRLSYSDGAEIDITAANLAQHGLKLIHYRNGVFEESSASRTLYPESDDYAELYVYSGDDVTKFLSEGLRCFVTTLRLSRVAFMPDQRIELHVGADEYLYTDSIVDGSFEYTTELISGSLPAGITAYVPGRFTRDQFVFFGTATEEYSGTLVYRVTDNVQNRQFSVKIYLSVLPQSDACDILSITLGDVPGVIDGTAIRFVLPTESSGTLNAVISAGAAQTPYNGAAFTFGGGADPSIVVTSQSGTRSKTYTLSADMAAAALPAPTGVVRAGSVVSWNAVSGAGGYLVTLKRSIGSDYDVIASYNITQPAFDMREYIERTGEYIVSVRAVSNEDDPRLASAAVNSSPYYCAVGLAPVEQITVFGSDVVVVNNTAAYTATVLPADANSRVTWSVLGGTGTAEITQAGVLTGKTAGTVTVQATAKDGSGIHGQKSVTVADAVSLHAVTVDVAGISGAGAALWIDGVEYSGDALQIEGNAYTVQLLQETATNAVVYSYNDLSQTDPHQVYPTAMSVWLLEFEDGAYTATRTTVFDNLLRYAGSSIRITGNKGIRMITSIATDIKNALTGSGINGYTLVEYGTAVAWTSEMGDSPLVLGESYTKSAYAYRKGVSDPVFKLSGGMTQYTNVLVGFTNAQCVPDLAMRPYIVLEDGAGRSLTLYGGMIHRSIGYIAYQNRKAFAPRTASYNYIWSIIHYVYGNLYDADYQG